MLLQAVGAASMPHQILLALRVRSQNTSWQSGHCRSRDQLPSASDLVTNAVAWADWE
jgi:hypothetical protein